MAEKKPIIEKVILKIHKLVTDKTLAPRFCGHYRPFNDGNGRTARALATLILYKRGYDFRRLFALEDYCNTDRPAYYKAINLGKTYEARRTDITLWLEYFIKGFKQEIDSVKEKILRLSARAIDGKIKSQIYLTPESGAFPPKMWRMLYPALGGQRSCICRN